MLNVFCLLNHKLTPRQEAAVGDIVALQGEFSATFALADFSLRRRLIPVCAVTERVAQEEREGEH